MDDAVDYGVDPLARTVDVRPPQDSEFDLPVVARRLADVEAIDFTADARAYDDPLPFPPTASMDTIDQLDETSRRWTRAEKGKWRADITLQDIALAEAQPSSLPARWWRPTNTLNIILRAMLGRSPASCPFSVSVVDRLGLCVLGAPVQLVPERPLHADPWDPDFELPGASPPSSEAGDEAFAVVGDADVAVAGAVDPVGDAAREGSSTSSPPAASMN